MTDGANPLRIAHFSDIHCGDGSFSREAMEALVAGVNALDPDVVAVAGDLTGSGYEWEYEEAAQWLAQIEAPKVVVPGNHDGENAGHYHFENLIGPRYSVYRHSFDPERAEFLGAPGLTVVGADSSEPGVGEGRVGRLRQSWIEEQFARPEEIEVLVIHHHLVSIPGSGRERNTIADDGELLARIIRLDVDIVLSGHKHVPWFWSVNGTLIANSGTATTKRLRGFSPPSWHDLEIDGSSIRVYTNYAEGKRTLSLTMARRTQDLVESAFQISDDFLETNRQLGIDGPS
ncbi:MAG: metallophosphoesterase family protein [Acidimicrobiia bacterium]